MSVLVIVVVVWVLVAAFVVGLMHVSACAERDDELAGVEVVPALVRERYRSLPERVERPRTIGLSEAQARSLLRPRSGHVTVMSGSRGLWR